MESLYRKYRPQTFADVVGQQHVVGTLERAVLEGRTSHAYLFCGPRGTGKTTMARLLAKSLMCEQGSGHLPDGTCEQCALIAEGDHPDVYELDAASRTGVDNVREEIINRVSFAPVRGRYKIYIIDEVHMLTTAAFNALLKTLEEPPEHVVFVLCTTDPQKIPETILSRVQRFDFRAIGDEDIHARLAYVCGQEGFSYDEDALALVVRHARGGMRDALSTLEQLSVFGGGTISAEAAQDLLGAVPGAELDHVVEALAARDVAMLFLQVGELVESGRDPLQFTLDLAARMRDVYVVCVVGPRPEVLGAGVDVSKLQAEANALGAPDRIARMLTILGDAARQMATAPNQRLVLEIAFTRMARPQEDLTLESLAERLAELERKAQAGPASGSTPVPTRTSTPMQAASPMQAPVQAHVPAQAAAQPQAPAPTQAPAPAPKQAPAPTPASTRAPAPAQVPAQVSTPAPTKATAQAPTPAATQAQATTQIPAPDSSLDVSQPLSSDASTNDQGELQRRWRQTVGELVARLPSRGSLLSNSSLTSDDGSKLVVSLPKGSSFALKMLERPDVRAAVEEVVTEQLGPRTITYREGMTAASGASSAPSFHQRPAQRAPHAQTVRAAAPQPNSEPVSMTASSNAAPQAQAPNYPMPWEEDARASYEVAAPPMDDQVPYEEVGMPAYEEPEEQYAPAPQPTPQPQPMPHPQRAPQSASQPQPSQPAAKPQTEEPSVPKPPDDLPEDLAAVLANAFEVFGNDVRVSRN